MAVDQYAITTLADLKAHLGITDSASDSLLEAAINRATYAIEAYLDRKVVQRRFREWTTANGGRVLPVSNPPIAHVHFCGYGSMPCMSISSSVASDVAATVSVSDARINLVRVDSTGNETTTQVNFASHNTASEVVDHINTVTGFSATLSRNCSVYRINRIVGRDLKYAPLLLTYADIGQFDTTGDLDRGLLYIGTNGYPTEYGGNFPVGPVSVLVDYDGGFATVPYDIVQACLQMASTIFNSRGRDGSLASESFGDYSYSSRAGGEIDAESKRLLSPWKRYR